MANIPEAAQPLADLRPEHAFFHRHRLGRLRVRYDGDQAQGVLHP
jgi:hypothetical protein